MPPARTVVWSPVETLAEVDVTVVNRDGDGLRIELIDRRLWTELVSLSPAEAAALSAVLAEKARQAGWVDPVGEG